MPTMERCAMNQELLAILHSYQIQVHYCSYLIKNANDRNQMQLGRVQNAESSKNRTQRKPSNHFQLLLLQIPIHHHHHGNHSSSSSPRWSWLPFSQTPRPSSAREQHPHHQNFSLRPFVHSQAFQQPSPSPSPPS